MLCYISFKDLQLTDMTFQIVNHTGLSCDADCNINQKYVVMRWLIYETWF